MEETLQTHEIRVRLKCNFFDVKYENMYLVPCQTWWWLYCGMGMFSGATVKLVREHEKVNDQGDPGGKSFRD